MRVAAARSPSAGRPEAPSGPGVSMVPEASITARARMSSLAVWTGRRAPRTAPSCRPRVLHQIVVAAGRRPSRACSVGCAAPARRRRPAAPGSARTRSCPVGYVVAVRRRPAVRVRIAAAAESTLNFHGENIRTWPQRRMPSPTRGPASSTSGVRPRGERMGGGGETDGAGADDDDGKMAAVTSVHYAAVVDVGSR